MLQKVKIPHIFLVLSIERKKYLDRSGSNFLFYYQEAELVMLTRPE